MANKQKPKVKVKAKVKMSPKQAPAKKPAAKAKRPTPKAVKKAVGKAVKKAVKRAKKAKKAVRAAVKQVVKAVKQKAKAVATKLARPAVPASPPSDASTDHAFFGALSVEADQLGWKRVVDLAGQSVSIDLNADATVSAAQLDTVAVFARDLARFDALARAALRQDLAGGDSAQLYVSHHLSELSPAIIQSLIGAPPSAVTPEQFLGKLALTRVGLYPDDEEIATFDYTISKDATQYVLAVRFDGDGIVTDVDMES